MTEQISYEKLVSLIDDDNTPDELLAQYFEIDEDGSDSFFPELLIKSSLIHDDMGEIPNLSTAAKGILGKFNKRARRKRKNKFERKIAGGFGGTVMVSEGDSWFQYPVLLKDVIDHLSDRDEYAIFSLGFAGDWSSNILEEEEYLKPTDKYAPKVFLISGGGNDLVGKRRLVWLLKPFMPGRPAEEYLGVNFDKALAQLEKLYRDLYNKLNDKYPDMKIIGHGYDYAIPDNGKWLGKPMKSIGIDDPELQREITKCMMNRFNDMKIRLASNRGRCFLSTLILILA